VLFRRNSSHPRRSRRMRTFGAEGVSGSEAPRVGYVPARGGRQSRRDASEAQCGRGGVVGWFGAEGAVRTVASALSKGRRNTWLRRTCKGASYEAETRGAACKGGLVVRRHAGGLYEAGSYCYNLVKCVKPFVRNGKGVIGVNDHTQGPPINSGSLVIERTHINEKRAPKASV
jgi:hypothetical protein